jgi:anti-sigma factor RsiW
MKLLNRHTCKQVSRILWDYAAYRLPESDWERVERHLQDCARCRREMEQYQRAVRLVEAARSHPAPASETTWYALRAQLESASNAASGHVVRRRRNRRYSGMAILGGLVTAGLAIAILLPAHPPRLSEKAGLPPSASLPPSQDPSRALVAVSTVFSRFSQPIQSEEIQAPEDKAKPATHLEQNDSLAPRLSYANYIPDSMPRSHVKHAWIRTYKEDRIEKHHRPAPQPSNPNGQYASSIDGDRPSDTMAKRTFVMDPLPSSSNSQRRFVMDMVNLSTPTVTPVSYEGGDKDQDIW